MSSERRMWAVIALLAVTVVLQGIVGMRGRSRADRALRKHWAVLLQLEAEATARRAGRPRSPRTPPQRPITPRPLPNVR